MVGTLQGDGGILIPYSVPSVGDTYISGGQEIDKPMAYVYQSIIRWWKFEFTYYDTRYHLIL